MDELWNEACPCGHEWREHSWNDGGCGSGWLYEGPDPGIATTEGCMCQLAHTDKSRR